MKYTRIRSYLKIICSVLFALGVAVGMLGRQLSYRDTKNFQSLQEELTAPDIIDTVLYDEELGQIYVCFNDASYVDVHDINGTFLWAVSAPYMRNTDFCLRDGMLYIYRYGSDAYVYSSSDGSFLAQGEANEMDLPPTQQEQCPENITHDNYRVWRIEKDSSVTVLVNRPWWHRIFDFMGCWMLSACAAVVMGVVFFLDKKREKGEVAGPAVFSSAKARFLFQYSRAMCWVHILFSAAQLVTAFFGWHLWLGIFILVLHFIISGWVLDGIHSKLQLSEDEEKVLGYWRLVRWVSIAAAFLTAIAAMIISVELA